MKPPKAYVLDCSVTLSWFFDDEATPTTDKLLLDLPHAEIMVPSLWHLELANSLNMALRKNRTDERRISQFLDRLLQQSITTDHAGADRALSQLRPLAARHALTVYDTVYLDLAMRTGLPLATLDQDLTKAAKANAIPLPLP